MDGIRCNATTHTARRWATLVLVAFGLVANSVWIGNLILDSQTEQAVEKLKNDETIRNLERSVGPIDDVERRVLARLQLDASVSADTALKMWETAERHSGTAFVRRQLDGVATAGVFGMMVILALLIVLFLRPNIEIRVTQHSLRIGPVEIPMENILDMGSDRHTLAVGKGGPIRVPFGYALTDSNRYNVQAALTQALAAQPVRADTASSPEAISRLVQLA